MHVSLIFRLIKVKTLLAYILLILSIIISGGCALIHRIPPREKINLYDAEMIISDMERQSGMIRSFYAIGVVSIQGWILGSDADILIAGIKDPFSIKIEITHSWGRPIFHMLIKEDRINVISFQEKVEYAGAFNSMELSKFLPGFNLDHNMIWTILSGHPPVVNHEVVGLTVSGEISLMDNKKNELEVIYLPVVNSLPRKATFPEKSLDVFFSDFREDNGIPYAGEIDLRGEMYERKLKLKINRMSLNSSIPDQIFQQETPADYETVNLNEIQVPEYN